MQVTKKNAFHMHFQLNRVILNANSELFSSREKKLSFVLLYFLRLEIAIYRMSIVEKHDKPRFTRINSTMQMEYKATSVNKHE